MIQFALKKINEGIHLFPVRIHFFACAASAFMEADHRFFIMPKPWSWIPNVFFLLLIHPFALKKIEPPHIRAHIVPYKYLQDEISTYIQKGQGDNFPKKPPGYVKSKGLLTYNTSMKILQAISTKRSRRYIVEYITYLLKN